MENGKKACLIALSVMVFLGALSILLTPAYADNVIYTTEPTWTFCTSNNSSSWQWKYLDDTTSPDVWETHMKNYTCRYACNNMTGRCNPDSIPPAQSPFFLFLFPLTAVVMLYLINSTKPEDWPLHLLCLGIALFLIIVPFGIMADTLPAQFLRPYQLLTVGTLIIMIYYILKMIARAMSGVQKGG